MNISGPFVVRPVATTLIWLGVVLAGWLAHGLLPIAPLPQIELPVISVRAKMPGASPEVMAATVATPLERSLGAIAGVSEMTSRSTTGQTRITLQFDLSRDINSAATDVQGAINAARAMMPSGLQSNPSFRKANPSAAPIMTLALTSATLSQGQLYDIASTTVQQKLSQVQGVGEVQIGGSSLPAVRIELNPDALAQYGVALDAVRAAIAAANSTKPKGFLENDRHRWTITANDQLWKAADYKPLIVAWRNDAPVRLSDIAKVEDSVEDINNIGYFNHQQAILVLVRSEAKANIIRTVDEIREDLGLSSKQKSQLNTLRKDLRAKSKALTKKAKAPTSSAGLTTDQRLFGLLDRNNAAALGVLTSAQLKRFHEIQNQILGYTMLVSPKVQKELGLDSNQVAAIEKTRTRGLEFVAQTNRSYEEGLIDHAKRVELLRNYRVEQAEVMKKVLTKNQAKTFKSLVGKPLQRK
jgi:multidrug efflux pump subunit AcrB